MRREAAPSFAEVSGGFFCHFRSRRACDSFALGSAHARLFLLTMCVCCGRGRPMFLSA